MNAQEFLNAYTPARAYAFALQPDRCHIGSAPTLKEATEAYGTDTVLTLIDSYVVDLERFCTQRNTMNKDQRAQLATVILTTYNSLRVTELSLFSVRAKAGKFGKFYNTLEPMDITVKLSAWADYCNQRRGELYWELWEQFKNGQLTGDIPRNYEFTDCVSFFDTNGQMKLIFN